MQNRETGKTYKKSPMGGTREPQLKDTVAKKTTRVPSEREEAVSKLLAAYNNKAYASPTAPLLAQYKGDGYNTVTASNRGGDRLGFVTKDRVPDEVVPDSRWKNRYGVGIDNTLPVDSGYYENNINTPLGDFDYGHDGDTAFAGFTPNLERTSDYYINGSGQPWSMDYSRVNLGDTLLQAGEYGAPTDAHYFAGAFLPGDNQYIPNYYNSFNTPLGQLELETNNDVANYLEASFNPNDRTQYYIQALANLLKR
jgi:hypothetical protein